MNEPSITPYALNDGGFYRPVDDKTITEYLTGKKASDFPSPDKYPPPQGYKEGDTKCGCLYTVWGDEDIKLETIWQPLWDFQSVLGGHGELTFFQNASDERKRKGKVCFALDNGSLIWPKRYHVWEIELQLGYILNEYGMRYGAQTPTADQLNMANTMIRFVIGEKDHLNVPFSLFMQRSEDRYFLPLPLPLYLPSRQNFRLTLSWDYANRQLSGAGNIRAVLGGYLHREIP